MKPPNDNFEIMWHVSVEDGEILLIPYVICKLLMGSLPPEQIEFAYRHSDLRNGTQPAICDTCHYRSPCLGGGDELYKYMRHLPLKNSVMRGDGLIFVHMRQFLLPMTKLMAGNKLPLYVENATRVELNERVDFITSLLKDPNYVKSIDSLRGSLVEQYWKILEGTVPF